VLRLRIEPRDRVRPRRLAHDSSSGARAVRARHRQAGPSSHYERRNTAHPARWWEIGRCGGAFRSIRRRTCRRNLASPHKPIEECALRSRASRCAEPALRGIGRPATRAERGERSSNDEGRAGRSGRSSRRSTQRDRRRTAHTATRECVVLGGVEHLHQAQQLAARATYRRCELPPRLAWLALAARLSASSAQRARATAGSRAADGTIAGESITASRRRANGSPLASRARRPPAARGSACTLRIRAPPRRTTRCS
jgi:hypothetical protein